MMELTYPGTDYIIGTAREIKSLYKNLELKTVLVPLFVDEPTLNPHRMYGISIDTENGFYTVIGETAVAHLLMGEIKGKGGN